MRIWISRSADESGIAPALNAIDGDEGNRSFDIENGWPLDLQDPPLGQQAVENPPLNLSRVGTHDDVGDALFQGPQAGRYEIGLAALDVDVQKIDPRMRANDIAERDHRQRVVRSAMNGLRLLGGTGPEDRLEAPFKT